MRKKTKYAAPIEWAKKWTRNNVKALRLRSQGRIFDAETCELQASISKDFCACHLLLNLQFQNISKP